VHARARRLREAGQAALERHLDGLVGRRVTALVEQAGRARGEDFTEIGFDGSAAPGDLITGEIAGHDGARAALGDWEII
jgi:threonylcarbamoyladenosine tRNA methylthiotransferase MtaB